HLADRQGAVTAARRPERHLGNRATAEPRELRAAQPADRRAALALPLHGAILAGRQAELIRSARRGGTLLNAATGKHAGGTETFLRPLLADTMSTSLGAKAALHPGRQRTRRITWPSWTTSPGFSGLE